jgi:hypothetical protein
MIRELFETAFAVLISLGGGGAIVVALSAWLGKIWAERLMERERLAHDKELEHLRTELLARHTAQLEHFKAELEIAKTKLLAAHHDKVALYRHALELLAPMGVKIGVLVKTGQTAPAEVAQHILAFDTDRIRVYAYLAMFAPQSVMNAYDSIVDYLLDVADGRAPYEFQRVRETGLALLNEIRRDLGLDSSTIRYLGARQ